MASRGRWDVGKAPKKPRKEDADDRFGGISPAVAPIIGPIPPTVPAAPGPSAAPSIPPPGAVDTSSPPSVPATTVHEAARAFTELRVRTAPETASPSASGAGQPSSPKKRKAARSLSGLAAADSTALASDDARAVDGDGDTAAGPNPSGPMGELLQVFGQIQLNKDFYDAIARTESCAGRGARAGPTQADADRAAFEAAVGAASEVLRRQVRGLAEAGQEASPAFLQAYALNAISTFATQAESSYSGEDLGSIDDPAGCSSVDRPSTGTRPGRSSAERSVGNAPAAPADAPPPPPPADVFNSFELNLNDGADGEGGLQEQITSLERSASVMALQSPCESWGAPGRGGGPSASLLMREAAELLDTAEGRGQSAAPAEDARAAAARRQRRRQRPASAEGEHESMGPQRQVRRSERPALGTVAEQRVDAPAVPGAVVPPQPAVAAAPATPGAVGVAPMPLPIAPALYYGPDGPDGLARDENLLVTGPAAPAAATTAAPAQLPPAPAALLAAGATAAVPVPRPQRPQAAPGQREKRDPRPSSSSGGPSHLSNDPPKRQRKGPGLVVGSAPGPGLVQPAISPPGSAVASRGSVGGAADDRDDADSGGGSGGDVTGSDPSAAAAPAAWGPSLVCADLTLHEVASQYWPSFKAAGKGRQGAAELSHEEQARVEELTEALERAILGAVGPEGAAPVRRRLNAKVKSLAAASAFDELLRERNQGVGAAEGLEQREESCEMPTVAVAKAVVPV